jgi:hypothetical protein
MWLPIRDFRRNPPTTVELGAVAVGALAFGALAIGALAIGRLVVGRLAIVRASLRDLEIENLTVRHLNWPQKTGASRGGDRYESDLPEDYSPDGPIERTVVGSA